MSVPISVVSKKTGEVIDQKVISLKEGQTSSVITHPTIKRVRFTMTLDSVQEECR